MRYKIIMDVDTGVDDAMALLFAAKCESIDLLAVGAVAGNVSHDIALRNTLAVLSLAGREDIPVAPGAKNPLEASLKDASDYHGANGLSGVVISDSKRAPEAVDAADQMIDLSLAFPGEIILAPTGPLTNVALAIKKDKGFAARLKEIVFMGGAALCPGNVGPLTEFNIGADPEAARIVLSSDAKLTMVGLDVTDKTILPLSRLERGEGDISRFVYDVAKAHSKISGTGGITMHDPLTIGFIHDRTLLGLAPLSVDVETKGELTRGMTVVDRREGAKANAMVALEVDSERFNSLWLETVLG
jgi:purine nucleosidase